MINSLNPDQMRQNVRSDLVPNSLTLGALQFRPRSGTLVWIQTVSHGLNYVICRTILYLCLFYLILLVLVNIFFYYVSNRAMGWFAYVEQFLKFNTNSAVSVTRGL